MVHDVTGLEQQIGPVCTQHITLAVVHQIIFILVKEALVSHASSCVADTQVLELGVLLCVHRLNHASCLCDRIGTAIRNFRLTLLAGVCRDHDDTIGRTRTVKCCSCRILQDLDRLDVGRVDIRQWVLTCAGRGLHRDDHTIHYIKRRCAVRDRSDTTDVDHRSGTH